MMMAYCIEGEKECFPCARRGTPARANHYAPPTLLSINGSIEFPQQWPVPRNTNSRFLACSRRLVLLALQTPAPESPRAPAMLSSTDVLCSTDVLSLNNPCSTEPALFLSYSLLVVSRDLSRSPVSFPFVLSFPYCKNQIPDTKASSCSTSIAATVLRNPSGPREKRKAFTFTVSSQHFAEEKQLTNTTLCTRGRAS